MGQTEKNSEVESENFNALSSDNALTNPKADRLGYATFARYLADSICKMSFPEGFVIAVYGSWGSGKSTLLNFLVHYLKEKPEDEQPIIVPFNPWLFSGHEDITRRFIDQLQAVLSEFKSVPKGLKDRLADFGKLFSEIPIPYAPAGKVVEKIFDDKQKDTSDLKEEVENTLLKQHPRIVVTIDDIDRLATDEIRQLFRVVKAIPNFTNVVYVLVCDKEIALKALADTQGTTGEAYLDKLVQVPFELPIPNKNLLRRLLFEKLNFVLADTPTQLLDRNYWGNIYYQGIDQFITNTRDITRLINTLSMTYPAVQGEVNSVDFIAVESLRVFCPTIYDIIRKNPKAFAGDTDTKGFISATADELKSLYNSWIAQLQDEDKEPVKRLLLILFPKLSAIWGNNTQYVAQQELTWRRQLRVCSLEVFPVYFRLALPEGELSNTEMKAILALAGDAKAFGETLVELANQKRPEGTTQVRIFLEQLEDYTEKEIPLNSIPSIVQALLDVGDRLLRPEDEPCGMFDFGNDIRIERIISHLLRRLEEPARFEVLKQAMSDGKAVLTIVDKVVVLGQQHGKFGASESNLEEERLISAQHLDELEEIALNKVQDAVQQNSLLQTPGLAHILYYWREQTSEDEVKQWVKEAIKNDEGLVDFFEKFFEKAFRKSESNMGQSTGYGLEPNLLEPYVDVSLAINRLRSLLEKDCLTEEQKNAIAQFIEEYDRSQQEKDSDDPLA
ncbi:P-loop NTPase fold protein [Coleofasciculus sp. FACHB-SPT9]|uniref:KAP family NTPase n=1 Tax=Cyanophyceae TaxID=3028117 RepID=UPI001687E96E|nr:P-loop NTPase fold protein [Coleofasciculus sp. FACHB-SPT9]MBD1888108.1 AAA family ATPase [Coleofasciculus sp. FACHB-SPT9]